MTRGFRMVLGVLAGAATLIIAPQAKAQATTELAKKIEADYGIAVPGQPPPPKNGKIHFRPAAPADPGVQRYLQIFHEELKRYPKRLLAVSRFKTLALVQDLTGSGEWGAYEYDFGSGTFYVNVRYDNRDDWYMRHNLHHELGHAIDWRINGMLWSKDPRWILLNAPDFQYGTGGKNIRATVRQDHSDASAGFFSLYSKGSAAEDKAEVFAGLMMPQEKLLLDQQCARDPVLKAKVDYLKDVIDYFSKSIDEDKRQVRFEQWIEGWDTSNDLQRAAEIEKLLLDDPGLMKCKWWSGRTLLHMTILSGQRNTTGHLHQPAGTALGKKGITADPNAADDTGWTPLHLAVMRGDPLLVSAMLEAGGDPTIKDKFGGTPVDWARKAGNAKVVEELNKAKTKAKARPRN